MFDLKKETRKKNLFLGLSIIFAFLFIASVFCTVMGEASPVQFLVNSSPINVVVPPALLFFLTSALYRNSKKAIKENTEQ